MLSSELAIGWRLVLVFAETFTPLAVASRRGVSRKTPVQIHSNNHQNIHQIINILNTRGRHPIT
jgi:hypothetical protein